MPLERDGSVHVAYEILDDTPNAGDVLGELFDRALYCEWHAFLIPVVPTGPPGEVIWTAEERPEIPAARLEASALQRQVGPSCDANLGSLCQYRQRLEGSRLAIGFL